MPVYKLKYFDLKGRAELPRLMFAEAGCSYEDIRISFQNWPKEKADTPFGQLPVLLIDDKPLPQSGAIVRYLAREFNLQPENSLLIAYADMIVETLGGAFEKFPYFEKDEAKKAELTKQCFDRDVCPVFTKFEKKFAEEKKQFLIGQKLTYADLALMNALESLDFMQPGFSDGYPALKALAKRVHERPNINKWIAERPKTDF